MARIGISITKEVAFRDSVQQFNNTYYYQNGVAAGIPNVTEANDIIDALVALERTFHSGLVTFAYARLWNHNVIAALSEMISQRSLSGVGTAVQEVNLDKERAYLFRCRAGTDSRGQPVYLRKWYHSCGQFPGLGGSIPSAVIAQTTAFGSPARSAMAANMDNIHTLAAGNGPYTICAKSGRDPDSNLWVCHAYLEHHQLGDQWRGA